MEQTAQLECIPKGGFGLPKVKQKYQTKTTGYSEEGDFLYYNNFIDERELAEVTNFKYTQDSSDSSY